MIRLKNKKTWTVCVSAVFLAGMQMTAFADSTGQLPGLAASDYYSDETWAKLQDNVLEYEEIPDLVHEYNRTIVDTWEDLDEIRQDMYDNVDLLRSQEQQMEWKKEAAEDDGDIDNMINYATQEAILKAVSKSLNSTASSKVFTDKTMAAVKKGEGQITKGAQSLMISYDSLRKQRDVLEKVETLYAQQYQQTLRRREQGLATDTDVTQAQVNQMSTKSTIESINSGLLQMRPLLCQLTGWAADAEPEIAAIPIADQTEIQNWNLEEDTKKAIGNNSTLILQRTSAAGKTYDGVAARLAMINEGDEKMTMEMRRLYEDVLSKQTAYKAALDGYQSASRSRDRYDCMYQQGMLSETEHLGVTLEYYQKKTALENADTTLRLAMENYRWAVKGLAELE